MDSFHGQQRDAIIRYLVEKWLPDGPAVSILQGFPGCGKSLVAASVARGAHKSLDPIEPSAESGDPVSDILIDLALALDAKGIPTLLQAFDKEGMSTVQALGKVLLDILREHEVLIIIDEFQRLLPKGGTVPPKPFAELVEKLNGSVSPRGRLLLISNRSIKEERWCEKCHFEELRGLHVNEGVEFFSELLEAKGLGDKVPKEKRKAIVRRLSGNPRALKTLVYALRTDSLEDLIPEAPDLGQTGDAVLDDRLLEEFERELPERALPKLEANLLKFMRWLSVHRRPFQKEALAQFTGGQETPEALRRQLFDRFLLEQVPGGDVPHKLAREISVNRLRPEKGEWVQAHNLAANYHMRRFEARQLAGASTLPASFAELRHHLYEAGRIGDLRGASDRLTKYALSQIRVTTPVPTGAELLEERIALLAAIPDDERPRPLEYQLALCLEKRGKEGDREKALGHARNASGPGLPCEVWLFRLNLEYVLHGIDAAFPLLDQALAHIPPEENAHALYRRCGEMLVVAGRSDEAIKLLEKGIATPGMTSVASLYQACAELLAKADRLKDAIELLEKGIAIPGMTNVFSLYESCAELMAKSDRLKDAIELLEKGIATPVMMNVFSLYQSCAELMAKSDRLKDAIELLEKGIATPGMTNVVSLYQVCAELMAKADRLKDAIELLEKGIATPGMTNVFSLYLSCAELMAKADRLKDAIELLEKGIPIVPPSQKSFLYQAAIHLVGRAGDELLVRQIATRGLADVPVQNGRNRIAETALRVASAYGGAAAIRGLQDLRPPSQLDAAQRALADYMLARISGDLVSALTVCRKGRVAFPDSLTLLTSEIDVLVALGQTSEAYPLSLDFIQQQGRDNPVVWLKAFVSLAAGHPEEAKAHAAVFAGKTHDASSSLSEAGLLSLWAEARNGLNGPLAHTFPGAAAYLSRNMATAPEAAVPANAAGPRPPAVLAVATEWDSKHGGLSTFNRDLCTALAASGARVVCYVPKATPSEVERAKAVQVELVQAPDMPGAKDVELLLQRPRLPADFMPDIVIGHDRVTGRASVVLARDNFPSSKRVLFIHTSPEEIEWHKEPREESTSAERAAVRKREQLDLAVGCALVVAVGPRLASEFRTDLFGAENPVEVLEITPGLPAYVENSSPAFPPTIRCLVLGRVEDYQLKGLDLAARALGSVVQRWRGDDPPKLVVRGAPVGTDAELIERLKRDASPAALDIVVRNYSANEREIRSDLREASLVLMPSKKEGFGLVGLEAIAQGIPTLISASSGLAATLRVHAPGLANDWILPVADADVTKWAERIELYLTGREGAFARAAALRAELALKLDWSRAASAVLGKLVSQEPTVET